MATDITTDTTTATMCVVHRGAEWWIVGIPDSITSAGPYTTRKLAEHDMEGMQEFFEHEDDVEFILGL